MAGERWRRTEELFHLASQLAAGDRAAYLTRECGGDEELRREVETLIEAFEGGNSFIERPALSLGLKVISAGAAETLAGRSIGHYKIVRLLGEGGMGAVYLAEDVLLERHVALKFITSGLADDPWAKEQLTKEARAIARLENPNICAVYGLEEADGHNFIVMQYVEGETLAALLGRGPLDTGRVHDLAEQIAGALCAAHARGLVHRDVKPQNIIVTAAGQVKILDFGLAKFTQPKLGGDLAGATTGQTSQLGPIVGTVAYMSPEQTRGEELDNRSDIFSFGIVLSEMLGGGNHFRRATEEETITAIRLGGTTLPAPGPAGGLARITLRCLEKERGRRYQTTEQLLAELRALRSWRGRRFKAYPAGALAFLLLLLVGAGFVQRKLSQVHTLAVLPVSNQSADPSFDYLSKGVTRNLYDKLSYLPRLRVKLPSGTAPDAEGRPDPLRTGRELRAEAILSGELVRHGGALLLRVRVLNTSDGSSVWERTFDAETSDLLALQDEVASHVTSALGLWLVGSEKKALTRRQTDSEEALRLYMRGRDFWSRRDRENMEKAIECFEQAVALDAAFAEAYAGLADAQVFMNLVSFGSRPTGEVMDKARFAAKRALYLNDTLADAHASLGLIRLRHDWDWPEAESAFKQAIALDPDYAPAHYGYSNLLAVTGRHDESIRESETAKTLDPYSPLAAMNYGRALYYARRHEEADAVFLDLLAKNPDNPSALYMHALVLIQRRQYLEALAPLERLSARNPLFAAAPLGYAYGKLRRREEALGVLRSLDEVSKREGKHVPPQEGAIIYMGLGEVDKTFTLLEAAYAERFASLIYLTADPLFDELRPDPRFDNLAGRLKILPAVVSLAPAASETRAALSLRAAA